MVLRVTFYNLQVKKLMTHFIAERLSVRLIIVQARRALVGS